MSNDFQGLMLSPAEAQLLQGLLDRERERVHEPKLSVIPELPQAPDVYIARTPSGGIAGYTTPLGTDSGSDVADAHYGVCDIYRIRDIGSDVDVMPARFQRPVWNLSTTAIPANTLIGAVKDKTGKWLAVPLGGGSSGSFGTPTLLTIPDGQSVNYGSDVTLATQSVAAGKHLIYGQVHTSVYRTTTYELKLRLNIAGTYITAYPPNQVLVRSPALAPNETVWYDVVQVHTIISASAPTTVSVVLSNYVLGSADDYLGYIKESSSDDQTYLYIVSLP